VCFRVSQCQGFDTQDSSLQEACRNTQARSVASSRKLHCPCAHSWHPDLRQVSLHSSPVSAAMMHATDVSVATRPTVSVGR
jgi:hypothetical protein